MKHNVLIKLITSILIIGTVWFSFYSLMPSNAIEESNDPTTFNVTNALEQLKIIAAEPHYTGSEAHRKVETYIVDELEKMGLEVEIQEDLGVNLKWRAATQCRNILARIKGKEDDKSLLLLTHYDSRSHSSLGASDAGSGVVTILEGIRAYLANNPTPRNDIIICITDAEEIGLLGANAFVTHHPWAENVGLVLNFEARGSGGPSYMLMETNGGNKNLLSAFERANTTYPVTNSLMYSIYKMLPNDTDLTIFREEGDIEGFNFAFIDDHFDYHTAQDSYERLDINSLKHQADYLMATLNYFSTTSLDELKSEEDYVYFNFPGSGMISYPFSWSGPILGIGVLLIIVLIAIGRRKRMITGKGVLRGIIPMLASLLCAIAFAILGWKFLMYLHPSYQDMLHGFTYNGHYYMAAFTSFTIAMTLWIYNRGFRKSSLEDLMIAPIFLWLLLNGFVVLYLKGASFFMIPTLTMMVFLIFLLYPFLKKYTTLLIAVLAIPTLLIFAPLIQMLPIGLGLNMMVTSSFFIVMLLLFLLPIFKAYKKLYQISVLFLILGMVSLVLAELKSDFSEDRKLPNSLIYLYDTDENEAYWGSYNAILDDYSRQYLGEEPTEGSYVSKTSASKYNTGVKWHKQAEVVALEQPVVNIEKDTIIGSIRKLHVSITTQRKANEIEILTNVPIVFEGLAVNGQKIDGDSTIEISGGTVLTYTLTPEHGRLDLHMDVARDQQIDFDIREAKYDLLTNPNFTITPRQSHMMPMPFVLNDATIIKSNLKL